LDKSIFPEDDEFITQTRSRFEINKNSIFLTGFLYPWQISLARNSLLDVKKKFSEWGGFDNALKKRLAVSEMPVDNMNFNTVIIRIKPDKPIMFPNVRSLLDTLVKSGIEANEAGDILQSGDSYIIVTDSRHANIKIENTQTVIENSIPADLIKNHQENISNTVSSVRLDSVCSVAFKPSRGKIKGLIENGGAMVDYKFAFKGGKDISQGSIISLRGFPRIKVEEIGEMTKKGRTRVTVSFLD
jgi:RNA-binding protein YlmH